MFALRLQLSLVLQMSDVYTVWVTRERNFLPSGSWCVTAAFVHSVATVESPVFEIFILNNIYFKYSYVICV